MNNEIKEKYKFYQDEEGNVYKLTTDLEQLILKDFYKSMIRNNEKQERIDKAIDYIKNNCEVIKSYYPYIDPRYINIKTLLNILEGSDKE